MFVVLLTYVAPLEAIDAEMRTHMRFLDAQYAAGHFIASGRRVPRTGGVILARGESKAAVEALLAQDPFVSKGLAQAEVVEFNTSQYAAGFEPFADPKGRAMRSPSA
jgi:uncharacterized protein YciI